MIIRSALVAGGTSGLGAATAAWLRAPEVLDRLTGLIPMRRTGRPEEVAEPVAFLASDRVGFSTGAGYDISGGRATY